MQESDEIEVHQVNLNKCYQAQIELGLKLDRHKTSIALVQEPYLYKGRKVVLIGRRKKIAFNDKPRAIIITSKELKIEAVSELCSRDIAVGLIKIGGKNTLVASIYMDILKPPISEEFEKLIQYADRRNFSLLIGADVNAHGKLWHSNSDNSRGRAITDYVIENGLRIENQGNQWTFECATGKSIIDITMTRDIKVPVKEWRVSKKANHSDHHTIRYKLRDNIIELPAMRPWVKADWVIFKSELKKTGYVIPDIIGCRELEELVGSLYSNINKALDKACPFIEATQVKESNPWFTKGLYHKRKIVSRLYKKMIENKTDDNIAKYKEKQKSYNKHMNKVKKKYRQRYKEALKSPKEMADYVGKLIREKAPEIGTILKADGHYTLPGYETLEELANRHFYGHDVHAEIKRHEDKLQRTEIEVSNTDWINTEKINMALVEFKSKKSSGPDGLKPISLKHLDKGTTEFINFIYKATIRLHYTPEQWTHARVVFIPKPGKSDYKNPKSYRPISLTNYLIKGLEKLCRWKMEDMLEHHPINNNQHGFRKGFSTETAISNTVNHIEKNIMENKYCLGIFLDIQSAFDTIKPQYVTRCLKKHGAPDDLHEWYLNYLTYRRITIEGSTDTFSTVIKEGLLQGGVCSASFWAIAFDRAVEILNSKGLTGNIYADDGCGLIGGNDLEQMFRKAGQVMHHLATWGKTCGLKFNPVKTEAVLFSRDNPNKRKFTLPKLKMEGMEIKLQDSVKYLGVTLDRRLFWTEHINSKINLCKQQMMTIFSDLRGTFGPKPKLVKWAYEGIIRPKLTYACLTWGHEVVTKQTKTKLRALDRLAIRSMATIARTTPQAALELLVDMLPLELHIQQIGLNSRERLKGKLKPAWMPNTSKLTHVKPHLKYWEDLATEMEVGGTTSDWCDEIIWDKRYTVNLDSFDGKSKHNKHSEFTVYTDGSKMGNLTGSGFVIYHHKNLLTYESLKLNDNATVFQAEIIAIKKAAEYLLKHHTAKYVKIFSDSQAALQAVNNTRVAARSVLEAMEALEMLTATGCRVRLAWVKAHIGIEGNELADQAAKNGAENLNGVCKYVHVRRPQCEIKMQIKQAIRQKWDKNWTDADKYSHTKYFLSKSNNRVGKLVLQLSKSSLSKLVQIVTGHNFLSYFQSKQDCTVNPMCRLCAEAHETFHHLITYCPATEVKRRQLFLDDPPQKDNWKPKQLLSFAETEPTNSWLHDRDHLLEEPIYELDINYSITDSEDSVHDAE